MKKIFTIILLGMSLLVGCENIYRDELAQIHKEIYDINARLDAFCKETNTNIAALQTMIAALQAKDYVTGVVPVIENGKEIGYQITFEKSGKVTVYHGKDGANGADGADGKDGKDGYTPKIGVKLHTDGLYYWTLDGEWLTDENGNMVKAVGVDGEDGKDGADGKDGQDGAVGPQGPQGPQGEPGKDAIAPQLKIEDGNWYISVDGGNTWDYVGQATGDVGQDGATGPQGPQGEQGPQGDKGDSIFSDIEITEEYVIITLSDGNTQIILPTWTAFNALKTQVDKLNADMQALQTLVAAWEANDYVKSVTALPDGSGYILTFVHSGNVTIYNGKDGSNGSDGAPGQDGSNGTDGKDGHTPVISVEKDTDGVWYWTIDGEWLLDSNGNKVKAVGTDGQDGTNGSNGSNGTDGINGKDGITPRFKIENGMWYVSYDEGQTWELAGQATGNQGGSGEAGDSMFAAVDSSNPDYIIIALTDGRTLKFPTWSAFEALKAMCNEMNMNISSLQSIVTALQNNDYVTGVTEITDNGKVIGYTIHFSKSAPAVIYHGKDGADGKDGYVPNIGLKQDTDGVCYWTLDGEWLLDVNGQRVKASAKDGVNGSNGSDGKDGVSPKLKIENGNWYVSYDNGATWEYLAPATGDKGDIGETGPTGPQGPEGPQGPAGEDGKDGDSIFSDIEITAEYIIITLADGVTKIQLPTWKSFSELAAKVELLNADVTAIKALVEAWNQNDYVKSVTPLTDGSGYVLEFVKSGKVTIYHGKDGSNGSDGAPGQDGSDGKDGHSPVVSVRQDIDGVWYWTIDGEWLFDGNGNKVVAVGKDGAPGTNGITPKFKIEEGFWYVSYDNGNTWEMAGQATGNTGGAGEAGDSLFAAVDSSNEDFIVVVLTDGRTLKFPTWAAFEELKALCNQMNTNISSLQTLVNSSDYVTGVSEIWDNGEVIGYTISFTKSNPVVIYHGKNGKDGVDGTPGQDGEDGKDGKDGYVPNIGLKQDTDGVWYWTLDGSWLLDSNGQRVKASGEDGADGSNGTNGQDGQNGITPRLKIENGYWCISYDNGSSWEQIGQATGDKGDIGETGPQGPTGPEGPQGPAGTDGEDGKDGDTLIGDIEITDDYVLITLADGQQIQVPTWAAHQALEQKVNQMNTNIEAIQTILTALQNNDYVTGVTKIYEGGKEIGYTINFSKSGSVTIYHGKDGQNGTNGSNGTDGTSGAPGQDGKDGHTPVISVKQDTDGIWYWTVDGEWLLDTTGNKVKAVGTDGQDGANGSNGTNGANGKDGVTPKLKVENGYWYVSYDNGQTWESEPLGQATGDQGPQGDSLFSNISQDSDNVYLTLSNGEVITIPLSQKPVFDIPSEYKSLVFEYSENKKIPIAVLQSLDLSIHKPAGWKVVIEDNTQISITAPSIDDFDAEKSSDIIIMASSKGNVKSIITIKASIESKYIQIPDLYFRQCCDKFDINHDGKISKSEAEQVTTITISGTTSYTSQTENTTYLKEAVDFTGINQFVNLTYIDISETYVRKLDVSGLQNLTTLYCKKCPMLSEINLDGCVSLETFNCAESKVNSLDLSSCKTLKKLGVYYNPLRYLKVDSAISAYYKKYGKGLSSESETSTLNLQLLNSSEFTLVGSRTKSFTLTDNLDLISVDLSGCKYIQSINLGGCTNLSKLELPQKDKLQSICIKDTRISSLNLEGCMSLVKLLCTNTQITSLDVSGLNTLETVECYDSQIRSFNAEGCSNMETLYCYNNQIALLNVNGCNSLKYLKCYNNNLGILDLSKSGLGIVSSSSLDCSPMNVSLSTLYLKTGAKISNVTSSRSTTYIPSETEIIYKD